MRKKSNFATMKKLSIFSIILLSAVMTMGQIKVVSNKVTIGEANGQTSNHSLEVKGHTHLDSLGVDGRVTIGQLNGLNPNFRLGVKGNAHIDSLDVNDLKINGELHLANNGFSFTTTTMYIPNHILPGMFLPMPTLLPVNDNYGRVGTMDNKVRQICAMEINAQDIYTISDVKAKRNIKPMAVALDRINRLSLVNFDYKEDYFLKNIDPSQYDNIKKDIMPLLKDKNGFLAQDVEALFPNLVHYNSEADLKQVNYLGFIPELTKAIQELSAEVERLQTELMELKSNCCNGNEKKSSIETEIPKLYQNTPNPFNNDTKIEYFIPSSSKSADLFIYDLNGKQKKHITITTKGQSSYVLNANDLEAGMFVYTLIVDNSVIDTKKMILTQ